MADLLATPEDLASLLETDELDRATAVLNLEIATGLVQAIVGQRLVQVVDDVVTLYLDGYDGSQWLTLPERPVSAVSSVLIGTTPVTDWSLHAGRSRLFRPYGWRSTLIFYVDAPSKVVVTYTHGYPEGSQKLQLARNATLMLAAGAVSNPTGAIREQIDDYAVQYADQSAMMAASSTLIFALRKQYAANGNSPRLVTR